MHCLQTPPSHNFTIPDDTTMHADFEGSERGETYTAGLQQRTQCGVASRGILDAAKAGATGRQLIDGDFVFEAHISKEVSEPFGVGAAEIDQALLRVGLGFDSDACLIEMGVTCEESSGGGENSGTGEDGDLESESLNVLDGPEGAFSTGDAVCEHGQVREGADGLECLRVGADAFEEADVCASGVREFEPRDGFFERLYGESIGTCDEKNSVVRWTREVVACVNGSFDPREKLGARNYLLRVKMATAFGLHLIFNVQGGNTGAVVLLHRSSLQWFHKENWGSISITASDQVAVERRTTYDLRSGAKPSISVGNHWRQHGWVGHHGGAGSHEHIVHS